MEFNLILPPVLGFLGLLVAFLLFLLVMRFDGGSDEVKKIGEVEMPLDILEEVVEEQNISIQ